MCPYSLHIFIFFHLSYASFSATATPTPTAATPAAQLLRQNSGCSILGEALAVCGALTSGFTTLQPTSQAHCLCYSGTVWMPLLFDNAVATCADYASTAVPAVYSPIVSLAKFCAAIGDIDASTNVLVDPTIGSAMTRFTGSTSTSYSEPMTGTSSNSFQPTETSDNTSAAATSNTGSITRTTKDTTFTVDRAGVTTQASAANRVKNNRMLGRGEVVFFSFGVALALLFL